MVLARDGSNRSKMRLCATNSDRSGAQYLTHAVICKATWVTLLHLRYFRATNTARLTRRASCTT